ncbi:MAG TPA: PilZ domain-containing protein [Gemmataceae bacterium]|jgi:hypothetical protein|nr:PilZ domain-containing protein [Gemmataceae bacterium]
MYAPTSADRPASEPEPIAERRIPVRRPCRLKGLCHGLHALADASWSDAQVYDISTEGIGLVLGGPVDAGTILELDLQNTAQTDSIPKLAHVTRTAAQADGSWRVGCRFVRQLGDDELKALLAQGDPAPRPARVAAGRSAGVALPRFPLKQVVLAPMRWTFLMLMVLCLGSLARSQFEPDWLTPDLMLIAILAGATLSLACIIGGWVFRLVAAWVGLGCRPG